MVLNFKKILLFVVILFAVRSFLEKDLILFLSKCLHVLSNLTNQTDLGVFSLCFFYRHSKIGTCHWNMSQFFLKFMKF